jgi:spore germination protein KC
MKMKKIKLLLLIIVLAAPPFLTGCWDNYDVSDVAIVTAIGIDKLEDGRLTMTWQILKPNSVQSGTEDSQAGKAYTNYTAAGLTLNEAHKELIRISGRRPFYGHIQVLLIGEKLAWEGIEEVTDLFERQYEFSQSVKILMTQGMGAQQLLDAESDLEILPAVHLRNMVEANTFTGEIVDLPFYQLVMDLENPGTNTVISALSYKGSSEKPTIKDMQMEKAGIFKKGKLLGYISAAQVQDLLFITDQFTEALVNIEHPLAPDSQISVEILRGQTSKKINMSGDEAKGIIVVSALARISETHETKHPLDPDIVKKIEDSVSKQIRKDLIKLIKLFQEDFSSDVFGFGELVYKNEYDFWKSVQDDWDTYFAQMPIEILVDVKIKRAGLINKPSKAR